MCTGCRYGGRTARAILEPYGFQETHSDDWVSNALKEKKYNYNYEVQAAITGIFNSYFSEISAKK